MIARFRNTTALFLMAWRDYVLVATSREGQYLGMSQSPVPSADAFSWHHLVVPTNPTDFWTAALVVVTIGLGIVAYFGLRSVALSKSDMQNRLTRETVQCAIDHCDQMAQVLLPEFTKLFEVLAGKGVHLFVHKPDQVSFEEREEIKKINRAIEWMGKLDNDHIQRTILIMNRLECWSMAFTHNPALASETVAFEPCSEVFCQMVMALYPAFLTQRRTNPASGPFQNVVTLFNGWYARKAQGPMLEQLERLQSDSSKLPPTMGISSSING